MRHLIAIFIAITTVLSSINISEYSNVEQKNIVNCVPSGISTSAIYSNTNPYYFSCISKALEKNAYSVFEKTGKQISWAICRSSNKIQYFIFYDTSNQEYTNFLKGLNKYDFVRIGTSISNENLQTNLEAVQIDNYNGYIKNIFPNNSFINKEKWNKKLENKFISSYLVGSSISNCFSFIVDIRDSIYYTVKPYDQLGKIASKYHTTIDKLCSINAITDPNDIKIGQVIIIK